MMENSIFYCLVERMRGRGREKWWDPPVFSPPPSKYNLSKLERIRVKSGKNIWTKLPPHLFYVSGFFFFFFFFLFFFFWLFLCNVGFFFFFGFAKWWILLLFLLFFLNFYFYYFFRKTLLDDFLCYFLKCQFSSIHNFKKNI